MPRNTPWCERYFEEGYEHRAEISLRQDTIGTVALDKTG